MSDSSIIEARLSVLEHKLSEVQARLQKTESTQPFKIEAGKVFIEEAPIKNAAINAASDECITANREAIIENAIKNQAIGNPSTPMDETPLRIYAMTFFNGKLTLSTNDREDFWLEIDKAVGWIKFEKLSNETEFTADGALFVATEVRSASDSTPFQAVQARCVLWRQREAVLSAVNTFFFHQGQPRFG